MVELGKCVKMYFVSNLFYFYSANNFEELIVPQLYERIILLKNNYIFQSLLKSNYINILI